ncbi:neuropeptide-like 1 isoform X2 [Atheta coriaria]|uniref:neuropeptide-like 1 isoform X2 n=1 Tax=Dalotia coriaria TaxID=877792 RepID=UPI0031F3AC49
MGILKISVVVLALCCGIAQTYAQSDEEISNVLEKIFSPESESSIHARVLRRDIVRRLYDALQREDLEDDLLGYKRSIGSLARWDNMPTKRNLAALAKGGYIRTLPDSQEQEQEEEQDKRSLASLARSGQLPNFQHEDKRGIASLARNGELHSKRDLQELIDDLYEKRNLGSLARSYSLPAYGKRYLGAVMKNSRLIEGKRNLAALARDGYMHGKRNVAALLRQDKIHGPNDRSYDMDDPMPLGKQDDRINTMEKRNVGSAKANGYKPPFKRSVGAAEGARAKRDIDYYSDEYAVPVYQNQNVRDYEELMKALTGEYPPDKRFLGRLPQMGKSKTTPSPKINYE